jgi:predicted MFS family arabinose efflux permease
MDIATFVYIALGWSLFHWTCYAFLARKLVRSERFRKHSVPVMALYAGGGSYVTTMATQIGLRWVHELEALVGGPVLLIALFGSVYASFRLWLNKFAYLDPPSLYVDFADRYFRGFRVNIAPSSTISWPVVGPVCALIWLLLSIGLEEMVGAGKVAQQRDRERRIAYPMAAIAAILFVIYITSLVLIDLFGFSMYGYLFN